MKKAFILKTGIMLSLIFSFLFTLISFNKASAKEDVEIVQTQVDVVSTTRKDNTINFVLKDSLDVVSITYEYTQYIDDILLGRLNHSSTDFKKINNYTFSFNVDSEIVGVKLWLVEYKDEIHHPGTTINDQTIGNNYVGNVNADYREKYVFITGDLKTKQTIDHSMDKFNSTTKYYNISNKLYFKFDDLEVDLVTKVEIDYKQYSHIVEPYWIFWSKEYNTEAQQKQYVASIDNNQEYNILKSMLLTLKTGVPTSNRYVEIGVSDDSKYQWYVELPSTTYIEYTKNSSVREVIDSVQIFRISYLDDGVFYEDIDVVMDPTPFIKYKENTPDIPWWFWAILVIIGLFLLGLIVSLIRPIFIGIKYLFIGIWYVLKYTIGLPFIIAGLVSGKEKKQTVDKVNKKRKKNIKRHGYNRDKSHFNFQ